MRHNWNGYVRVLSSTAVVMGTVCWLWGIDARAQDPNASGQVKHYSVNTMRLPDGTLIDQVIINGPPVPPPGFEVERRSVSLPAPDVAAGVNALTVPAFNWVFGCSAVSGAMIAGYYDRTRWPNIYTGPTGGGVMPLTNASWPTWSDGSSTYPNCPLIASKNGVDGRTIRGSIDDYWVQYNSAASDPYITNGWAQHVWGDAIGDYMKTSQSAFGNVDGSTKFYNYTSSSSQLTCDTMVNSYGITDDGTVGRRAFYQARGYTVTACYNQKTDNTIAGGFSFAQFKAEIDAGRPVMLNLEGHTVVGVGYDDSTNLAYIHDTWDYNNHTFTWGTSYSGMALLSVSIVNIQAVGRIAGDVDGDGKSDAVVWRAGTGTWYARHSGTSGGTYTAVQWGDQASGDVLVPGDYDGDGQTDLAVWRPSTGVWYILKSSDNYSHATYLAVQWGSQADGDIPVPGDYDMDGQTDPAIWRASTGTWYWLRSSDAYATYGAVQWGNQAEGDTPVPGDYDGDGKTDLAIWRPTDGTWYVLKSSDNYSYATYLAVQWGAQAAGDTPVPGDYDGDGKTDPAVWRPSTGTWYWLRSSDAYSHGTYGAVQWGNQAEGDVPMPGDYDGDGKTDPATWRPSTGMWYAVKSSDAYSHGSYLAWQWGSQALGDVPVRPR